MGNYAGYGQGNPTFDQNPILPSPDVQAFMKYGAYPVDYSTGVPKIEIPLYEIKSGKLSLPVSLSYHASGIRVNELASSTGMGWSLNAGGMVSRVINGLEDEPYFLEYDHYSAAYVDNYPLNTSQGFSPMYEYIKGYAFGNYDSRSDDYSYSVGSSLAGQFVYDINKNMQQRSFTNNVIKRTPQNTFEITGEDGTRYIFENKENVRARNVCPTVFNFLGYDEAGNVLSKRKSLGPVTSYQWGYQQQYPVVEIKNAANTSRSVVNSGQNNFTIQFPSTSRDVATRQFTVGGDGTIGLSIDFGGDEGNGTVSAEVSIHVTGPNNYGSGFFSLSLCSGSANCGYPSSRMLTGLAPGNYTLTASIYDAQNLIIPVNLFISSSTSIPATSGAKDFYYDSFEENGGNSSYDDSKTGHLSYIGDYGKALTGLSSGNYALSYWVKSGVNWSLVMLPVINITGGTYIINIPNSQIDDVRLYPVDAQMTTYTYDPLVGMTSVTDAKNQTTYYEYDSLQRLKSIRDKDRNIVKQIDYHYQGQ